MDEAAYPKAGRARWSRRKRWAWIVLALVLAVPIGLIAGRGAIFRWIAGPENPGGLHGAPVPEVAGPILARAMQGLEGHTLIDLHAHLAGKGPGNGNWVNPRLESLRHPLDYARGTAFRYAGLGHPDAEDIVWLHRLGRFADGLPLPSVHHVLAFDKRYDEDGNEDLDGTEFYVPNTWAVYGADQVDGRLVPAGSVHPYRMDAVDELQRCHAAGARLIKWLPSAQGIDPSHPKCAAFYAAMSDLGLTLLVHTGAEGAVGGHAEAHLNNPLHLRSALRAGVTVVIAHCACDGEGIDLDDPERPLVRNTQLFLRLMDEPEWEGQLFGEISAVTLANRFQEALTMLLARPDLHPRLVHASDWPLPAVRVLYRLDPLVKGGWLDPEDVAPLRALYEHNPLLFDFVLKRVVRHPETGQRFADEIFQVRESLPFCGAK
tara:strand:- start:10607 stop:11902 length:1296 start_codon:yes stop_codon:yes gene_type:complete